MKKLQLLILFIISCTQAHAYLEKLPYQQQVIIQQQLENVLEIKKLIRVDYLINLENAKKNNINFIRKNNIIYKINLKSGVKELLEIRLDYVCNSKNTCLNVYKITSLNF